MNSDVIERFTLRVPFKLLSLVKSEAKEKGVSTNALILQILWEWAEKNKLILEQQTKTG